MLNSQDISRKMHLRTKECTEESSAFSEGISVKGKDLEGNIFLCVLCG